MKNLKNLGQALTKAEQKAINGGRQRCYNRFQNCCEFISNGCISADCIVGTNVPLCNHGGPGPY